jgi:hypothetical protein
LGGGASFAEAQTGHQPFVGPFACPDDAEARIAQNWTDPALFTMNAVISGKFRRASLLV